MLTDLKSKKLNITELLKATFNVYTKNIIYVIAICLFVYLPLFIVFKFIPESMIITRADVLNQNFEKISRFFYTIIVILILFLPLATSSFTKIVRQWIYGEKVTVAAILDSSLLKWHRHIFSTLLFSAILIVTSCLIIPMIYFSVAFGFYTSYVAITDKWGMASLIESAKLLKGDWFRTFFIIFLLNIFTKLIVRLIFSGFLLVTSSDAAAASTEVSLGVAGMAASSPDVIAGLFLFLGIKLITAFFDLALIVYFFNLFFLKSDAKTDTIQA